MIKDLLHMCIFTFSLIFLYSGNSIANDDLKCFQATKINGLKVDISPEKLRETLNEHQREQAQVLAESYVISPREATRNSRNLVPENQDVTNVLEQADGISQSEGVRDILREMHVLVLNSDYAKFAQGNQKRGVFARLRFALEREAKLTAAEVEIRFNKMVENLKPLEDELSRHIDQLEKVMEASEKMISSYEVVDKEASIQIVAVVDAINNIDREISAIRSNLNGLSTEDIQRIDTLEGNRERLIETRSRLYSDKIEALALMMNRSASLKTNAILIDKLEDASERTLRSLRTQTLVRVMDNVVQEAEDIAKQVDQMQARQKLINAENIGNQMVNAAKSKANTGTTSGIEAESLGKILEKLNEAEMENKISKYQIEIQSVLRERLSNRARNALVERNEVARQELVQRVDVKLSDKEQVDLFRELQIPEEDFDYARTAYKRESSSAVVEMFESPSFLEIMFPKTSGARHLGASLLNTVDSVRSIASKVQNKVVPENSRRNK